MSNKVELIELPECSISTSDYARAKRIAVLINLHMSFKKQRVDAIRDGSIINANEYGNSILHVERELAKLL